MTAVSFAPAGRFSLAPSIRFLEGFTPASHHHAADGILRHRHPSRFARAEASGSELLRAHSARGAECAPGHGGVAGPAPGPRLSGAMTPAAGQGRGCCWVTQWMPPPPAPRLSMSSCSTTRSGKICWSVALAAASARVSPNWAEITAPLHT
ncbi:hypothetical protein SALB_00370 [Streptomyces noursei]|uniref:Uncharacterized protein n=1 Tax=Streptomyces noursei TaxID=1971 RepID=A0A401QQN1_STRNR|nr:hypothetical protein SALB_00370 [Streptomyces noursei]